MNKYVISFADLDNNITWIESINARNLNQAQTKLIAAKTKEWELDEECFDYEWREFVEYLFSIGIIVGDIADIESF